MTSIPLHDLSFPHRIGPLTGAAGDDGMRSHYRQSLSSLISDASVSASDDSHATTEIRHGEREIRSHDRLTFVAQRAWLITSHAYN